MMQENEILNRVIGAGGPLGAVGLDLNDLLSDEEANALRDTIATFLVAAADENAGVTVTTEQLPPGNDFKSIIYKSAGVRTNKLLAFSFRDAATETALPLLGITLTIYTGKWGLATIPQVAGVLKTLWSKLVVLRRPADGDAIDVLNALVRIRTKHIVAAVKDHPTSLEIETDSGLSRDAAMAALKSLRTRGVVEVVTWAEQTDDVNHLYNRWKVKL
jgi:hypothetical protein